MTTKSNIGTCSDCGHYTRDGKCVSEGEHCDGWQEDERGVCVAEAMQHAHGGANGFVLTPGEVEMVCLALIQVVGQCQALRRDAALGAKVRSVLSRNEYGVECLLEGDPTPLHEYDAVDDILDAIADALREEDKR